MDRSASSASDAAVSPIIATILMVAITVVVAGVLFALVQGLGVGTKAPAQLSFIVNDAQDRAVVKATQGDPRWGEIEVRMSANGGWAINGPPGSGGVADVWVQAEGPVIYAGNYVEVCLDSAGGDLILDLRHTDPTLGITTLVFSNVDGC